MRAADFLVEGILRAREALARKPNHLLRITGHPARAKHC